MSFRNDGIQVQEYVYDFAVDGGAVSTITLSSKSDSDPLPVGAMVSKVTMRVLTAFTSGGAATLDCGSGDDPDGYLTAIPVASLTANAMFNAYNEAGALLWDNTNDAPLDLYIDDATTGAVSITINTAAMTAGKAVFMVEYKMSTL